MPRPFDFQRVRPRKTIPVVAPRRHVSRSLRRSPRQSTARPSTRRTPLRFNFSVTQLVVPILVIVVILGVLYLSFTTLISAVLPVTRDTHIVLKVPISYESFKYYLYALSTVDHRTHVVELGPELLEREVAAESPVFPQVPAQLSLHQQRAELGRSLGLPIDSLIELPPYKQSSFSLSRNQIWYPYQDTNDIRTRKSYWWPGVSLENSRIGLGQREFWSHRQFVQSTSDEQFILSEPATTAEWEKLRPRLTRSAAFVQCPVAVINTTGRRGLATELASILDTAGIRVVRVDDLSPALEKSRIAYTADKPECAAEAELLGTLSPEPILPQTDAESTRQYRADIVWFVGAEMW